MAQKKKSVKVAPKIEKGIPVPGYRTSKYKFSQMAIGDSFTFPLDDRSVVSSAAWQFGRRNKVKFSIRQLGDKKKARIWRMK